MVASYRTEYENYTYWIEFYIFKSVCLIETQKYRISMFNHTDSHFFNSVCSNIPIRHQFSMLPISIQYMQKHTEWKRKHTDSEQQKHTDSLQISMLVNQFSMFFFLIQYVKTYWFEIQKTFPNQYVFTYWIAQFVT